MTRVHMDWRTFTLVAEGHAQAGPSGHDIVCAGISALTQALLNVLEEENDEGRLTVTHSIDEQAGSISINTDPGRTPRVIVREWYRVAVTGLRAIEQNYPEHIKITEVE